MKNCIGKYLKRSIFVLIMFLNISVHMKEGTIFITAGTTAYAWWGEDDWENDICSFCHQPIDYCECLVISVCQYCHSKYCSGECQNQYGCWYCGSPYCSGECQFTKCPYCGSYYCGGECQYGCSYCGSPYCWGECQYHYCPVCYCDPCICQPPPDCAGVPGGAAYIDDCDRCVGGNTGEKPCDCAGVIGGYAYKKTCDGVVYCLDGNQGVVNNQLPNAMLAQFNTAKNDMLINCLRTALWNNLDSHYGINISGGSGSTGFNPCDYRMTFNPSENITALILSAELFHAYQEQYLGGKVRQIQLDAANNYIGGSNIEFEETAMGVLAGKLGFGGGDAPGTAKLDQWCEQFLKDHLIHSNVVLTQSEKDKWFEAMEEFKTYYVNHPGQGGFFYDKPIDYTMLPASLLNLWNLSDCIY